MRVLGIVMLLALAINAGALEVMAVDRFGRWLHTGIKIGLLIWAVILIENKKT